MSGYNGIDRSVAAPGETLWSFRRANETDVELRERIRDIVGPKDSTARAQRFGQLSREFFGFGELRRQKKAPHKEVLYIPVYIEQKLPSEWTHVGGTILKSVNNASNDELTNYAKRVGASLDIGHISQVDAEFLLDWVYAEIGRRMETV